MIYWRSCESSAFRAAALFYALFRHPAMSQDKGISYRVKARLGHHRLGERTEHFVGGPPGPTGQNVE
jgi:hypothetical protein